MASPAQILANQQNARSSTGPRTEAGKQRSSLNALRHGITSQLIVLPADDLETYNSFVQSWHADLDPRGVLETQLVQTLADTQWCLNRIRAHETNLFALPLPAPETTEANIETDPEVARALAEAEISRTQTTALNSLSIREARLHKIFHATLAELKEKQTARKKAAATQIEAAAILANHHKEQGIPFDPQEFGFVLTTHDLELAHWRSDVAKTAYRAHSGRQNPPAPPATGDDDAPEEPLAA